MAYKKEVDLTGKCGTCKYYKPLVLKGVTFLRGDCTYKDKWKYKMRTESCKKYEKLEENK